MPPRRSASSAVVALPLTEHVTQRQVQNDRVLERRVRKETADVRLRAPAVVSDHLAAAQIVDFKPEVSIPFVCLEHRRVRVHSIVLQTRDVPVSFVANSALWVSDWNSNK